MSELVTALSALGSQRTHGSGCGGTECNCGVLTQPAKVSHTSTMYLIQYLDYFDEQNGHGINILDQRRISHHDVMFIAFRKIRRKQIKSIQIQSLFIKINKRFRFISQAIRSGLITCGNLTIIDPRGVCERLPTYYQYNLIRSKNIYYITSRTNVIV